MASQPRTCADCHATLGAQNTRGRCRSCTPRHQASDPEFQRRRSEGIRRGLQADPERRERYVQSARALSRLPQTRAASSRSCTERRLWERGQAAQGAGSPGRVKAGQTNSAKRLAWCPPHLRSEYLDLREKKHLRAAEARSLILEQHEIEMRRWRRSIGAEPPPPPPVLGGTFLDRASVVAARHADVASLWNGSKFPRLARARWAVFLALRRGGWNPSRIGRETGMDRKTVEYGLRKAEILAAAPGDFADLFRKVVAA